MIYNAGGRWVKAKQGFEDVLKLTKGLPYRNCVQYIAVCDKQIDFGIRKELAGPIYLDGAMLQKKNEAKLALRCFRVVESMLPGREGDSYRNLRKYIQVCQVSMCQALPRHPRLVATRLSPDSLPP